MGQRSQIYIRWNLTEEDGRNFKGLIARYFSWNYGERMVSRARGILEMISDYRLPERKFLLNCPACVDCVKKLERVCDVNFDMRDIVASSNIIEEVCEQFNGDAQYIFCQDCNDGQLFIDITDSGLKYCFMRYFTEGEPMDAESYMKWDVEDEEYPDWHVPGEYMSQDTIDYTEKNIRKINKLAHLMTQEEVWDFVQDDYSYLFKPQEEDYIWYTESWSKTDLEDALISRNIEATEENIELLRKECEGLFDDKSCRVEMIGDMVDLLQRRCGFEKQPEHKLRIVTENVDGELVDTTMFMSEWVADWYGDCVTVPENDAELIIAEVDGNSIMGNIPHEADKSITFLNLTEHLCWKNLRDMYLTAAEANTDPEGFLDWLRRFLNK